MEDILMFKSFLLFLFTLLVMIPPLDGGLKVRFSFGDRYDHHRHGRYHYYPNYRHHRYHHYQQRYYGPRNTYELHRVSRSRVVDTRYYRNSRIITLNNGMQFRIMGRGYDWTGHRAHVYQRRFNSGWAIGFSNEHVFFGYQDGQWGQGGYYLRIGGYEYRAWRVD